MERCQNYAPGSNLQRQAGRPLYLKSPRWPFLFPSVIYQSSECSLCATPLLSSPLQTLKKPSWETSATAGFEVKHCSHSSGSRVRFPFMENCPEDFLNQTEEEHSASLKYHFMLKPFIACWKHRLWSRNHVQMKPVLSRSALNRQTHVCGFSPSFLPWSKNFNTPE